MLKRSIFALTILLSLNSYAQTQAKIDSLVNLYKNEKRDTIKADILNKIAWFQTRKADYTKTVKYGDSALHVSLPTGNKKLIAASYANISEGYYNLGKYEPCTDFAVKALKLYEELGIHKGQAVSLTLLGSVFWAQDKIDLSLEYFNLALKQYQIMNDRKGISYCLNNIALVYYQMENYPEAIKNLEESVKIKIENHQEDMLASSYSNLGRMYMETGKNEKGLELYKKSYAIYKKIGDDAGIAFVLNCFGDYYLGDKNKNYPVARKCFDTMLVLAKKTGYSDYEKIAYSGIAKTYQKEKNYKEALDYYLKFMALKDSLVNVENSKNVSELTTLYETDKKEKENKLLQARNELSAKTIKQQKITTYFVITGLILSLALAYFIFRGLKKQKDSNRIISMQKKEVETQKHLIEEKQKEILDSITYAKRIQKAHLPTENYVKRNIERLKNQGT